MSQDFEMMKSRSLNVKMLTFVDNDAGDPGDGVVQ